MIRVLVVEDDKDYHEEIQHVFQSISTDIELTFSESKDGTSAILEDNFFDLVILDLKIPSADQRLDEHPEHGHAIFAEIRQRMPGTPIFVLTGSSVEDFIQSMISQSEQVDIWVDGEKRSTINFLAKYDFASFPEKVGPIIAAIESLNQTEVNRADLELRREHDRLIRIFTKKRDGVLCNIESIGDKGLSGANVLRVDIVDKFGNTIEHTVAKLAEHAVIEEEAAKYEAFVSRLAPAATPRQVAKLTYGGGTQSAVFYGLAKGYEESIFSLIQNGAKNLEGALTNLETYLDDWSKQGQSQMKDISEIRRLKLSDEKLEELKNEYDLEWTDEFESNQVLVNWSCMHGDLHGENILVSHDAEATIIDYGDVEIGIASFDPISLELSTMFHPGGPFNSEPWCLESGPENWADLESYLTNCPCEIFIKVCREWANRAAAGQREVAVAAYCYLLRQLKYPDTNKDLALGLLQGARRMYNST